MTPLTQLALLGTAEAAVILLRCKSAVEPGPFRSAFWTFMTCVLRVVFVQLGMTAMLDGLPLAFAVAAYAIPAAIATFAIHALDDQHERSRQRNAARAARGRTPPQAQPPRGSPPPPPPTRSPKHWDGRSEG